MSQESKAVTVQQETSMTVEQNMIGALEKLATNPDADPEKVDKWLDVQIKMMDRQAKIEYDNALAEMQANMPRISATGEIKNKHGQVTSKYMKYEDIDKVVRPLLQQGGFSLIHDRADENGKMVVTTKLKHRGGHEEAVSIPLPYDQPNALKNAVQAAVSTFSYGKRVNVCSLLNIVQEGEDDDGVSTGHIKIDQSQIDEIEQMITDSGADRDRFLEYMGASQMADIAMKDYGKATAALRRKAETKTEAGGQ
jgi:hypothetical protein